MPKILDRLVRQLQAKGKDKGTAFAIATSSLQKSGNLKPGTQKATKQGEFRGNLSDKQREDDRKRAQRLGRNISKSPTEYKSAKRLTRK